MKFAYSWLKELSGYNGSAEKLAEILSSHAFETEVVPGTEFPNIIVAKVTKIEKHPNADRLRVIELTDGKKTHHPVVCGAWNFEVGAIVPLALPGATIPHDQHDAEGKSFTLGKATIRGIESQGMICSGKELGISSDGKGILLLTNDYKLGEIFAPKGGEAFFDISIPANRPDLLGYHGVAREISALTNSKLNIAEPKIKFIKFKPKLLKVNIASEKLCPRYIAVKLSGIEVGPSPQFIQNRIKLSGHRPINNVVDITNYVMLEMGQPMHAFNANKIQLPIHVRSAYLNEKIKTLDGVERKLSPQNLVIADSRLAIGIAGVIGGETSMIDELTKEIILEVANFDSVSIRKTSRELGLRTDASVRYEKSLPIELTEHAAAYAVELLIKYAGAKPVEYVRAGGRLSLTKKISVDSKKITNLLGIQIDAPRQKQILAKFGFKVTGAKDNYTVTAPYYRSDVTIWQDLAEEIARFEGLDQIDPVATQLSPSFEMTNPLVDKRAKTAEILLGLGFSETYNYSFISETDLDTWGINKKEAVRVSNPMSTDQQYMRPNILINLYKTAEHNSHIENNGNYFEIGNIYWVEEKKIIQKTYLGLLCFDKEFPASKIAGSILELAKRLGIELSIAQDSEQLAEIKIGKEVIGMIGRINVGELKWVGVHLDFEEFIKHISPKTFQPIIKYPTKELDVAVWARRDLPWSKVLEIIRSVDSPLIQKVELFDVYTGSGVPAHRKSIAFRIVYQSKDKTLTDEEVMPVHEGVLKELKARLNLEVR
jgi:phenylalanyl-tRNA synthetase beta chain